MVTRGNLDDRIANIEQLVEGYVRLADERWAGHLLNHASLAESLRDYKRESNEWRATLADLRSTFIPRSEGTAEHKAIEAKVHGEIQNLATLVTALDTRVDVNTANIREQTIEAGARRSVFSDTRSIVATLGIIAGVIVSTLLILDRIQR